MKFSLIALLFAAQIPIGTFANEPLLALFHERCAACHEDNEEPELSRATNLSSLRAETKYIKAGDAAASPLYHSLVLPDGDKKRMPKSTLKKPLPRLTEGELAIVRAWVDGSAAPRPIVGPAAARLSPIAPGDSSPVTVARPFLADSVVSNLVLQDVQSQFDHQVRPGTLRYVTLTNLANERDQAGKPLRSDHDLDIYRAALSKLLNSLSWRPSIVPLVAIDPDRLIYRIDLEAYGLRPELWNRAAGASPHQFDSEGSGLLEAEKVLGAQPLLRADYFVFALSQPPLYHEALGLPGAQRRRGADLELEEKLGIRYDVAIQSPEAVRAGFQKSRVSNGNRILERLPLANSGYYWKSYDFDVQRQVERGADLFKAPLGPANGELTQNPDLKFSHDGGELVFSLPNGLQAYLLVDKRGARLDEAPFNVVTDLSRKDGRIINGISCISCHKDGMFSNNVKDEVLAAMASRGLEGEDLATVQRLYNQQRLEEWFARDTQRFTTAQTQCGWTDDMPEPVITLYTAYMSSLTSGKLAAELGVQVEGDLLEQLGSSTNPTLKALASKLRGNADVTRQEFNHALPDVVRALRLGQPRHLDAIAFTEFGLRRPGLPNSQDITVQPVAGKPLPISLGSAALEGEDPQGPPTIVGRPIVTRDVAGRKKRVRFSAAGALIPTPEGAAVPAEGNPQRKVIKLTPGPSEDESADGLVMKPAKPLPSRDTDSRVKAVRFNQQGQLVPSSGSSAGPENGAPVPQPPRRVIRLNAAGQDDAAPAPASVRPLAPQKVGPVPADSTPTTADPSNGNKPITPPTTK